MWIVAFCLQFSIFNFQSSISSAQPKQRRVQPKTEQQQQQKKSSSSAMSIREQIYFPTAVEMPEDVVWRRDIYREIDLTKDVNAGLYYPVQPEGKQMNLFTYIFKLAQNNYIPIYEYSIANDGADVFTDETKVKMKTLLDDRHIFYEEGENGKLKVDNSDIPSPEVTKYYLKESAYYDQANAAFHIKVVALCPVMMREDDFGGEAAQYPLFWIRYADLEPYLSRQTIMTSDVNNAAVMSMDDFFTLNKYQGKIYKTNNMLGKTLAQIAGGDTAKLSSEQRRIEAELDAFRNNIFGDKAKRDSLDSIANNHPQNVKAAAKAKKARTQAAPKAKKEKAQRGAKSSSSAASPAARVSVRRQRH